MGGGKQVRKDDRLKLLATTGIRVGKVAIPESRHGRNSFRLYASTGKHFG